jgi:hypothetical protein
VRLDTSGQAETEKKIQERRRPGSDDAERQTPRRKQHIARLHLPGDPDGVAFSGSAFNWTMCVHVVIREVSERWIFVAVRAAPTLVA